MTIDDIRQDLIDEGKNPEDYVILINKSGHTVWKKEYAPDYAKLALQYDEPIKKDVSELSAEQMNSLVALTEVYEENLTIKDENNQVMMAIAELYEQMLGGGE